MQVFPLCNILLFMYKCFQLRHNNKELQMRIISLCYGGLLTKTVGKHELAGDHKQNILRRNSQQLLTYVGQIRYTKHETY